MQLLAKPLCLFIVIAAIAMNTIGCGGDPTAKYIPDADAAKTALQTALTTWQSGAPHGPIEASQPVINVFDLRWQEGQKLESFEILEPLSDREQPSFNVKIKLAKQPEQTNVYLVVGIDPLLIFRDVDYQKATGQ